MLPINSQFLCMVNEQAETSPHNTHFNTGWELIVLVTWVIPFVLFLLIYEREREKLYEGTSLQLDIGMEAQLSQECVKWERRLLVLLLCKANTVSLSASSQMYRDLFTVLDYRYNLLRPRIDHTVCTARGWEVGKIWFHFSKQISISKLCTNHLLQNVHREPYG